MVIAVNTFIRFPLTFTLGQLFAQLISSLFFSNKAQIIAQITGITLIGRPACLVFACCQKNRNPKVVYELIIMTRYVTYIAVCPFLVLKVKANLVRMFGDSFSE